MREDAKGRPSSGSQRRIRIRKIVALLGIAALLTGPLAPLPAGAASAKEIDRDVEAALAKLYEKNASARLLRDKAWAVMVFPHMLKAGFLFGGQIGEGVLRRKGRTVGYYNSVAASYGYQAGAQRFGYALFFMNEGALAYLEKSGGFELGAGPSLVVVDQGAAKAMTSTTLTKDVYAFVFDQSGLMGGMGIQGSKITRVDK